MTDEVDRLRLEAADRGYRVPCESDVCALISGQRSKDLYLGFSSDGRSQVFMNKRGEIWQTNRSEFFPD